MPKDFKATMRISLIPVCFCSKRRKHAKNNTKLINFEKNLSITQVVFNLYTAIL